MESFHVKPLVVLEIHYVISNYIDHGYETQPSLYACNFLRLLKRMIIFNTKNSNPFNS